MAKVDKVISVEPKTSGAGKPYVLTTLLADGKEAQTLSTVREGDEGELTWNAQFKHWDFKKSGYTPPIRSGVKQFKADPDKQESIEKQSALVQAVNFATFLELGKDNNARVEEVLDTAARFLAFIREPEAIQHPKPDVNAIDFRELIPRLRRRK